MDKHTLKDHRRAMFKENSRWPKKLACVPKADWPEGVPETLLEVWRSRDYLVQLHRVENDIIQVTAMRTMIEDSGRMAGGINHSTMQRIKRDIGLGDRNAVEIYPPDQHLIDTQGARFMWVLPEQIPFMFTKTPVRRGISLIHDPDEMRKQPMSKLLQPRRGGIILLS